MAVDERRGGPLVVAHVTEYRGAYDPAVGARVSVLRDDGTEALLPHVVCHSPTGFQWGYAGSGPADLALSILAYTLAETLQLSSWLREGSPAMERESWEFESWRLHQAFKQEVVAGLERGGWTLPVEEVVAWLVLQGVAVRVDTL